MNTGAGAGAGAGAGGGHEICKMWAAEVDMSKVLLVHSRGHDVDVTVAALRAHGHEVVVETGNAGHAWNRVREEPWDVLVLSLDDHPKTALNAAEATRTSRLHGMPVVFVIGDRTQTTKALDRWPDASFTSWDELPALVDDVTSP